MAAFKCKMCGGDLEPLVEEKVIECEYCGTKQTIPDSNDEKRVNLYNRANRFRLASEFDKAAGIYKSLIKEFPEDAEAYWGLCLCNYGIEYVDDPKTARKVPSCHRASFEKMRKDTNYEMALLYADRLSRAVYEEQAKEIDDVMTGILQISKEEEPYDIFICCKENDRSGQRTPDSVLAQEIYNALTDKGYRVFFSRIILKDKLGIQYEPYIFSALNTAKVMLVVGTDYEHLNSVWVKNEWSRYIKIMSKDKEKSLIPCYRDMDPYDMPDEFSGLQSQDCSKIGFMQELTRGIDKLLGKKEKVKIESQKIPAIAGANPTVESLLQRALIFLEDNKWDNASDYCERVLDIEPQNATAYLVKLMTELHVHRQAELADCKKPFDSSDNYKKAVRFGDERISSVLRGYINHIKERNENERCAKVYNKAVSDMNAAITAYNFKSTAELFKTIPGFRDSDVLAEQCFKNAKIREEDVKRKALAVIYTFAKGSGTTLEDTLALTKTKIRRLEETLTIFDSTQKKIKEFQRELEDVIIREKQLSAHRSRLSVFSGKEKKRIDEEIFSISTKRYVLKEQIDQQQKLIGGYRSIGDVERDLEKVRNNATEVEKQIEIARANDSNEYNITEATMIYLNEPDVAARVDNIYPKAAFVVAMHQKNKYIKFGRFVQKEAHSPESIEWQILEHENGRFLLISKYGLDYRKYGITRKRATNYDSTESWETSLLRKWLNEDFLETAFSNKEREIIVETFVDLHETRGDRLVRAEKCTADHVFLLSCEEVYKYYSYGDAEKCVATDYARSRRGYSVVEDCGWWLRTGSVGHAGRFETPHVYKVKDGRISISFQDISSELFALVRPALWIDLNS